ncbi:flavodoxin domain-containing protein [Streptomyces sp. BE20]|uniref:flavodoxin family protein n=1 Tax=unclassified Streptomyces TaxID=2593676 RepID=UPI002E775A5F|nr:MULTISPECIES: flavodoxin domain-containing protein [unclassified Streptomyces]MED7955079.1 flavodoxin domain-containing protein [Streptomyces sp. BE303]MEE1825330.1 flavodoxin domain-containing protein [Streptomyces sp. BE20]
MHTVIVYESMYGNTREIAEAIAAGVHEAAPDAAVDCIPVAEADADMTRTADLLVVGGPTHMHGMSSGLSRRMAATAEARKEDHEDAAREAASTAEGPGLRTWFHDLPKTEPGTHAAAFDTRADMRMSGGAADAIAQRLSRHHYDVLAEPEGFIVEDADGPLRAGELDRARAWGAGLV